MLLGMVSLLEARVFRFVVRQAVKLEAWRQGAQVRIGRVEGSLFDPVRLVGSRWSYESRAGAVTRVEIEIAEAEFAWRHLVSRSEARWLRRLTLQGVVGKVHLPTEAGEPSAAPGERAEPWWGSSGWIAPARIEARNVDFLVQRNGDHVRFEGSRWVISELEQGLIEADRIIVKQPWLSRTFRDVRGVTAQHGAGLKIADLELEPGIVVKSFEAQLSKLARGRLDLDLSIAAFGGDIRVQAQTLPRERQIEIDATGTFSQINVAPLATFLGWSDAAGGTIKGGTFTFRGSPRNPAKASTSLRLEATDFQWESRQWDSLLIGVTLLGGRLQVPELELRQGHNQLSLKGEMAIPAAGTQWWQSAFDFNIAARIEDLTELSALMLPEFKYAAGRVSIDGSVRGTGGQFQGALFALGSGITWRNAPIEELYAAVKLTGNEFQLVKLELLNKDDYVRGRGVMNILGAKQYWGELRGSVQELATYAALLQKPIVPEPLAGGAAITWSGEGSAKGHSGKFSAQLQKVRTVGATAAMLHPVNAQLEGHYAPGWVQFSRFTLSDDESAFSADVTVGSHALSMKSIRLMHGDALWLKGEAVLPLDVWKAWPNTALATLLTDGAPVKVNLAASGLRLREASRLTGWKWPVEGIVDGRVRADGRLGGLETSGTIAIRHGRIPLGWSDEALAGADATLSLRGQTLVLEKVTAQHGSGTFEAKGECDLRNIRDVGLKLEVASADAQVRLFPGLVFDVADATVAARQGTAAFRCALDLKVDGPASTALVHGTARLTSVAYGGSADVTPLWASPEVARRLPLFALARPPWRAWRFDVLCEQQEPAPVSDGSGTVLPHLRLSGTGAAPSLTGWVRVDGARAFLHGSPVHADALLVFREGAPADPTIDAQATGLIGGELTTAFIVGPLSQRIAFQDRERAGTPEAVAPRPDLFSTQERLIEFRDAGVPGRTTPVYDWWIEEPAPATAGGASEPAPAPVTPGPNP